jgi:uncharacterized membrane protein YadS
LVRVTLLAPMVFVLAIIFARHHAQDAKDHRVLVHYARLVPWFVWGFIAMSIIGTLGLVPEMTFQPSAALPGGGYEVKISLVQIMEEVGKILLTWAMAAIGLEVNLRVLAGVSSRAVATGLCATIILAGSTLAMILMWL